MKPGGDHHGEVSQEVATDDRWSDDEQAIGLARTAKMAIRRITQSMRRSRARTESANDAAVIVTGCIALTNGKTADNGSRLVWLWRDKQRDNVSDEEVEEKCRHRGSWRIWRPGHAICIVGEQFAVRDWMS